MYQLQPSNQTEGVYFANEVEVGAEAAGGDHRCLGPDLLADSGAYHPAVLDEQAVHPLAECYIDAESLGRAVDRVDERLPAADAVVAALVPFPAGVDEASGELGAVALEPVGRRAGVLDQGPDRGEVHVVVVPLQVVVPEFLHGVLDAVGPLRPGARGHEDTAGQPGRASHDSLGLGDHYPARAGLLGRDGGSQPGATRTDHEDVNVESRHHCSSPTGGRLRQEKSSATHAALHTIWNVYRTIC